MSSDNQMKPLKTYFLSVGTLPLQSPVPFDSEREGVAGCL